MVLFLGMEGSALAQEDRASVGETQNTATADGDGSEQSTETAPRERADEAPIESAPSGISALDYEPTESISEDRSVSFPVDI
jgi:hypothetical protein